MRDNSPYVMASAYAQRGMPHVNYQANMMEHASPNWLYNSIVPKQEPMEEGRNDSGIASGGSDFHTSPDSCHSTSPVSSQAPHANHPYYSTPVIPRLSDPAPANYTHSSLPLHMMYSSHPLSPPNSEPMASPNNRLTPNTPHIKTDNSMDTKDANTTLTPLASPVEDNVTPSTPQQQNEDALKKLQMALEKNGLLPSPKPSEWSDGSKSDTEDFDEQGLRVPKVNSHGKVKTFKCKQCDFVAVTKLDFWEHSKEHIKHEKRLNCPKCPFVTEYKHHLEYHLRNHAGSKPFKCDKCSYSCVNKSMLNSHMKSHSNVYQYRCQDCTYVTKYCHSLKLHLRKYNHKPAMVLNPDGTPNPLPIIDVYGTRRGPKMKNSNSITEDETSPTPEKTIPFQYNQIQQLMNSSPQVPFPFAFPFLAGFPGTLPNALLLQQLEQIRMAQQMSGTQQEPEDEEQDKDEGADDTMTKDDDNVEADGALDLRVSSPVTNQPSNEDEETTTMFANVEVVEAREAASDLDESMIENKKNRDHICQFCNIAYEDEVMYTMHMGFHGYNDPFTCNMCGEQCQDRVRFHAHMFRKPHP